MLIFILNVYKTTYPFQTINLALFTTSSNNAQDLGPASRPIHPSGIPTSTDSAAPTYNMMN